MTSELEPIDQETLLSVLREMLPQPLKESPIPEQARRFIGGDPGEVVVDVGPTVLTVSEYALSVESDTAAILTPVHLGTVNWTKLPAWTTRRIVGELTAAASTGRLETFRECLRCGKELAETLSEKSICKTCEASEEGIVY